MLDLRPLSQDPNDYCYFDTETRALEGLSNPAWGDVTQAGAVRYSLSSKVNVFRYAIGDGPIQRWDLEDFDDMLDWRHCPDDLAEFMERALNGEAWFAAWNSFFDRNVVNRGMRGFADSETMELRMVIDIMAQAVASNLPAKLEGASKAIGRKGKVDEGKSLMQIFAVAGGGTPQSHPEEWERYRVYADVDVEELRAVAQTTRPLSRGEWEEFWTSEAINDRGLPVDRPFAERAAALASVYTARVNERVKLHTDGACWSVNQHVALANWVADQLDHLPEAADILVKKYEEDEEGDGLVVASLSLARDRVEKLIPYLERLDSEQGLTDEEFAVLQLLEERLYGASATPRKFAKLLPMLTPDDRLHGQYTFNGAQQTGRFSSRGVQVHNLTRAFVGVEDRKPELEAAAIEFINDLEVS